MLWLKGWLETRSRVVFALLWASVFLLIASTAPNRGGSAVDDVTRLSQLLAILSFLWIFIPVWLAGAGIRTQSTFMRGASRGIHGSTHFTLSLPVSRSRLLVTRAAVGFLETIGVFIVLHGLAWAAFPVLRMTVTPLAGLEHLLTVVSCAAGFYFLSVLMATFMDDHWHIIATTFVSMLLWLPNIARSLPSGFNLVRPMAEASPLITHILPWTTMSVAVIAGAAFFLASLKIVQAQEY